MVWWPRAACFSRKAVSRLSSARVASDSDTTNCPSIDFRGNGYNSVNARFGFAESSVVVRREKDSDSRFDAIAECWLETDHPVGSSALTTWLPVERPENRYSPPGPVIVSYSPDSKIPFRLSSTKTRHPESPVSSEDCVPSPSRS